MYGKPVDAGFPNEMGTYPLPAPSTEALNQKETVYGIVNEGVFVNGM